MFKITLENIVIKYARGNKESLLFIKITFIKKYLEKNTIMGINKLIVNGV